MTVKDLPEWFPERFSNKTNGVTPRRWLLGSQSRAIRRDHARYWRRWITDLSQLNELKPFSRTGTFAKCSSRQSGRPKRSSQWAQSDVGQIVTRTRSSIARSAAIHEYKRQLLNACGSLSFTTGYGKIPTRMVPRTFFFAGHSGAGIPLGQAHHKSSTLADTIDADPVATRPNQDHFLPEYNVSLAERLIQPAMSLTRSRLPATSQRASQYEVHDERSLNRRNA